VTDQENLTAGEKRRLLELARESIAERLSGTETSPPRPSGALAREGGAFVTLHLDGRLRGCIGNFQGSGTLAQTVREMARAAAFEDPRFPPLIQGELDQVDLEISVLTPLTRTQDLESIQVGRHGIYIIRGGYRGVLLPQVAVEWGWDRDTFLDQTCIKAGLPPGCWRDPGTEVYLFTAEVFGEKDRDR
jgi:AmmeMemoRadiSam system protein A